MSNAMYNKGRAGLLNGAIDLDTDTLKVLFVKSGYTFDADHNFVSQVSANEPSGGAYVRKTLANKTVTQDDTNDRAVFDADDVTWTALNSSGTIIAAIIFKDRGGADSANDLIAYIDLADFTPNGTDVSIIWSTSGILYLG